MILQRFTGTCELLTKLDQSLMDGVIQWVTSFPLTDWPRQSNASDPFKPAMPSNLEWHGFGVATQKLVDGLLALFPGGIPLQRMLGCILPGHSIPAHKDFQCEQWLCRVHVPLTTCPEAVMIMDDGEHHMEVGNAYRINTEATHALKNDGKVPRIHFMFDVRTP
jgi:hypothetical protein